MFQLINFAYKRLRRRFRKIVGLGLLSVCILPFKFLLAGLLSNLLGYLIYLALTLFLKPIICVALLYPLGVVLSYLSQKNLVFSSSQGGAGVLGKFICVHTIGYLLNLFILQYCISTGALPHQVAQLLAIVLVGLFLFLGMKYFVFIGK